MVTYVDDVALKMALNVLRRAGKTEVADELEKTVVRDPKVEIQSEEKVKTASSSFERIQDYIKGLKFDNLETLDLVAGNIRGFYSWLAVEGLLKGSDLDEERLDWYEDQHTLHYGLELTYVVDGFTLEYIQDTGNTKYQVQGVSLRDAIDKAREIDSDDGDRPLNKS
jgi:hypothetical protein